MGIVVDEIGRSFGEREARDIDDRSAHQTPQMSAMSLFMILQEIFARKDIVVDKEDVGAFSLRDSEIARRRRALTLSMKDPEPIADLELFQSQGGVVGGPIVDDQNFKF